MASLLQDVGHQFIVGLAESELGEKEKRLLGALKPAGIIVFAANLDAYADDWPQKLNSLLKHASDASGREYFFTAIDHEGGLVHRLKTPATHFPPARNWQQHSAEVARVMGRELGALGFNLSFAPVLDIDSEADNPIIGTRAFSTRTEEVISAGSAFMNALQAEGVLACGKHFPGHGATTKDSHLELPAVNCSKEELLQRELLPFKALIDSDLKMLMTAHVLYPAIDPTYPATLSEKILRGILRNELGFSQTVISDALEMQALENYKVKELPQRCLEAGVDILLVAQPKNILPLAQASEMAEHLYEAVDSGALTESTFNSSKKRILDLLTYTASLRKGENLECSLGLLGCAEHKEVLAKATQPLS